MTPQTWSAFTGASIIILPISSLTILLMIGDSLVDRGRSVWSTATGVTAGDTTAMAVSLADADALPAMSAVALTTLKSIGGSYLVYLDIKSILNIRRLQNDVQAGVPEVAIPVRQRSVGRRFLSAWTVTALNLKSIVSFIAFMPQFMSVGQTFLSQSVILLPTFVILAAADASAYALAIKLLAKCLTSVTAQRRFGCMGGAMVVDTGTLTLDMRSAWSPSPKLHRKVPDAP